MELKYGLKDQIDFLKMAAEKGVGKAIELYGEIITVSEAEALKKLTPAELKSLYEINWKIAQARIGAGNDIGTNWVCVNGVC